MKFAKLYNTKYEERDVQILVLIDSDEDGPKVIYKVGHDAGISEMSIGFNDSDEGLEECRSLFDKTDKTVAISAIDRIMRTINSNDL